MSWRLPLALAKEAMMAKFGRVTFTGDSGRDYAFAAYPRETRFKPVAAVYVITKREAIPDYMLAIPITGQPFITTTSTALTENMPTVGCGTDN